MTQEHADEIARDWIEAWNAHDLDRIMGHYAESVEFVSPFVAALLGDESGTLHGRTALRDYFERALAKYPDLTFRLDRVLAGVGSVTVYYDSINRLKAAEVMEVRDGHVHRVLAHYTPLDAA